MVKRLQIPKKLLIPLISIASILTLMGAFVLVARDTEPLTKQQVVRDFEREKEKARAESASISQSPVAEPNVVVKTSRGNARGAETTEATGGGPMIATNRPVAVKPPEGVYSFQTTGGESVSGFEVRDFPAITYRTYVHKKDPMEWTDHHYFLDERQTWAHYQFASKGRTTLWSRQYIRVGSFGDEKRGVEIDETLRFDPPMLTSPVPWEPGQSWEGTFQGETHGRYTGRSERRSMKIDGRTVEAWVDFLVAELRGKNEGTVSAERWLSPETGLTLFEHYVADVKQGPVTYTAEWTVRLRSLKPEHR